MTRLNLLLLLAVLASALYLVNLQYESRRLFSALDRAHGEARRLETDRERLQLEKLAQATPSRVENSLESACKCAVPRRPSPTTWPLARSLRPVLLPPLPTPSQAGTGHEPQHQLQRQPAAHQPCAGLAQQAGGGRDCTLVWPAGRALGLHPGDQQRFLSAQGRGAFARTLELPASRGRVLDRNGLILASSVPVPSIWAVPENVDRDPVRLQQLATLLDMPMVELERLLADEEKGFVSLKRQVDVTLAKEIRALGIRGIYQREEYKRLYPEGESAAHVVGFTNVDDRGQEGIELAFNQDLAGRAGSRRVIKDGRGRVVEAVGEDVAPVDGRDIQLSIDSKVQFFAYQKLREAVLQNKAKAGSVVVLDVQSGEVLALANYPSYSPARQNLSGEQLRNRALTDSFEPGSTMKPFVIALALEKGLVKPETQIQTAPGRLNIGSATISDAHPHGVLTVNEVIQKSSNVGTVKMAMQMQPRDMWTMFTQVGIGQKPQLPFPGAVSGKLRAYKTWRPIEQATMSYGYGLSTSLFQLAHAYSVFGRDGELVPVTMLKSPRRWAACGCWRQAMRLKFATCCTWSPCLVAPRPKRRPWAIPWVARPVLRTRWRGAAMPIKNTAASLLGWHP